MTEQTTPRPIMTKPRFENIPGEMKGLSNWVNWNYLWKDEQQRWTKPLLNPKGLRFADKTKPDTWGTFAAACDNLRTRSDIGIGFCIGTTACPTEYIAIDLDHVLTDGKITDPAALDIFETLDSYTEITPSGEGLHIWIRATAAADRRTRKGKVEIYDCNHPAYLTVTGNIFGNRTTIENRTAEIKEVIEKYLSNDAPDPQHPAPALSPVAKLPDSDFDIVQKMCDRNPAADRLWNGNMSDYPRGNEQYDHSAADQALTNYLAYWANYDAATIDRLFRQSKLMRPKWDEIHDRQNNRTYGQMTIDLAMSGHTPRTFTAAPNQSQDNNTGSETPRPDSQMKAPEDIYLHSAAQARAAFEDMILIQTKPISTGFVYLNQLLDGGLYPGLITMGAVTGEGKTTLALQMMDNIAAAGKDVLIFSLEMSRFELIAKSISRLSFKLAVNKDDAFTTRQLLKYEDYKYYSTERLLLIERAKREYFENIAPHVFIRQAPITGIDTTAIQNIMNDHRNQTGEAPVVLVDYIQLLTQPATVRRNLSDKQVIDMNVMNLKQLSRDFNTPVIGISSLNRQAYSTRGNNQKQPGQPAQGKADNRVTLTDFKESGAIEYSSDILLGLNRDLYDEKTKVGKMSLDILKYRNGAKGTSQVFDYYYRYNCFVERMTPNIPTAI